MKVFILCVAVLFIPGLLVGQDLTPPPAPIGLAATPASWSNINSFSLNWTDPADPSGIGTPYWYKKGSPPTSNADGSQTSSRPIIVTGTIGSQTIYVWLQDGVGNRNYLNYATTNTWFDSIAPNNVTININSGAVVTSSLIVTLNGLYASDASSGLDKMQFSNDNLTWSALENTASSHSNWDLSLYGGNTAAGLKTVYSRYRDRAGNTSASNSHSITYDAPAPVQLTGFRANVTGADRVHFEWQTVSEIDNYGFAIEKSITASGPFAVLPDCFIGGHGTTNVGQSYSFETHVNGSSSAYFRLRQIDFDGSVHVSESIQAVAALGVAESEHPSGAFLHQNYPNPFNPSTTIRYGLAGQAHVTLTVLNTLGQQVATLQEGEQEAGSHEARFDASNLSSGVYFYRIQAGDLVQTRRLVVLK